MKGNPYDLLAGLIRIHVLHHAATETIFGLGIIEELARHGYRLSPGTLYPLLHGMEARQLLRSRIHQVAGPRRRVYRARAKGRRALAAATDQVHELLRELVEGR